MALALTRNHDDALELVQDSMLKLVQHYASKPREQWLLLFYRILQNRIRDFHRRRSFSRLFHFFAADEDDNQQTIEQAQDSTEQDPQQRLQQSMTLASISLALQSLPLRQQQAFLLRAWQEFSVKETAYLLSISEGSVKTHYSRALSHMRDLLGDQHETL